MKKLVLITFALVLGLFFTEAKAQPSFVDLKVDVNNIKLAISQQYLAEYADKLEAKLKNKSVGYSFAVISNNNFIVTRAGGDARRAPDANPRKMSADDKFNVASVSKTITAAAVLKLLYQNRISVDKAVYPYLPSKWTLGANFKSITFRELLTHRAGIRCDKEVTFAGLRECVAGGVVLANKAEQKYNNSNFALFRLIIPRLTGFDDSKVADASASLEYANRYMWYVQRNIFGPLGLDGIELKPAAVNPALAYQYPAPVIGGDSFGDMTETSASRGWNISAKQLAIFMNGVLYTEKVMPNAVSERMKTEQLGLWKVATGDKVLNYEHGGYYPGKDGNGKVFNAGEMNTLITTFPNGMTVAIIVNSQFGPNLSTANAARDAMNEMKK